MGLKNPFSLFTSKNNNKIEYISYINIILHVFAYILRTCEISSIALHNNVRKFFRTTETFYIFAIEMVCDKHISIVKGITK